MGTFLRILIYATAVLIVTVVFFDIIKFGRWNIVLLGVMFAVWNLTPVGISWYLLKKISEKLPFTKRHGIYGYIFLSCCIMSFGVLAWIFDIGKAKTGTPTPASFMLFLPIGALLFGALGYAIGFICSHVVHRFDKPSE